MRKNKESEITLSETKSTSTQTPIEIALKIDENGIGATLYNTWKNRNVSSASQTGQKVVDAIKSGELLVEEVDGLLAKVRK